MRRKCRCSQRPREGVRSPPPRAAVTDGCEPPGKDAGDQTQVLCKSNINSNPLSHLSSPKTKVFLTDYQKPTLDNTGIAKVKP